MSFIKYSIYLYSLYSVLRMKTCQLIGKALAYAMLSAKKPDTPAGTEKNGIPVSLPYG
jgi:hypothetical protein